MFEQRSDYPSKHKTINYTIKLYGPLCYNFNAENLYDMHVEQSGFQLWKIIIVGKWSLTLVATYHKQIISLRKNK
jgi:hypothetical protein